MSLPMLAELTTQQIEHVVEQVKVLITPSLQLDLGQADARRSASAL
jgi:hypothetical protein